MNVTKIFHDVFFLFCADINSLVEGPTPFLKLTRYGSVFVLTSVENEDRVKGSLSHNSGSILTSIISNNNNPRLNTLICFCSSISNKSNILINPDYATMYDLNVNFLKERTARLA